MVNTTRLCLQHHDSGVNCSPETSIPNNVSKVSARSREGVVLQYILYSTYCTVASDVFIYVCRYSALYVCTYLVYKISPSSRRRKSHVMLFIHNELGQDRSGSHPQVCMPTMTQLKRLIKGFAKWLPQTSFNLRLTLC